MTTSTLQRVQAPELTSDQTILSLPEDMSIEAWEALGRRLCAHEQKVQWWIGDWWAHGDQRFGSKAQAIAENVFGRTAKTFANLAAVARTIDPSRRRDQLPFSHHAEVVTLPIEVADQVLDRALQNGWSVRETRQEVQRLRQPETQREELPRAWEPRRFQRIADMMRAAFSDWFGVGDPYASVLMALFEIGGDTISPKDLAISVDSHRPMSIGALHEAISSLRKSMEAESIDTNERGYCLTDIGLSECRRAIREEASALAGFGLEPANDF